MARKVEIRIVRSDLKEFKIGIVLIFVLKNDIISII